MARDFDGANDNINFGSDASIDSFTSFTISMWLRADTAQNAFDVIAQKTTATTNGWSLGMQTFDSPDWLQFQTGWSGTTVDYARHYITAYTTGTLSHIVWTYDTSSDTNDPLCYMDGVSQTVTQHPTEVPSGTYGADAASNMVVGETTGGSQDFDGVIGFFCYDNAVWDAAMVNRARWWGTPGGGVEVVHFMWTSDLNNKGTATANGTATGTTVTAIPKVERCWAGMMGVGR